MTLLTFISALKYILSLMLAVLGIIPYEAVKTSQGPEEDLHLVNVREQQPLQRMENKTFHGDQLFRPGFYSDEVMASIPARNNYSKEPSVQEVCFFTGEQSMPVYEYSVEIASDRELIQNVIISFGKELEVLAEEKILVVSRGH